MSDPVRPLVTVAAAEAMAAAAMTAAVALAAFWGKAQHVAPVAEVAAWVVVTVALALIWLGLYRRRHLARTPFLMVQLFALVAAWTVFHSDQGLWRIAGIALGVLAGLGLVLSLRPAVASSLH
jgi:hypothetical protein